MSKSTDILKMNISKNRQEIAWLTCFFYKQFQAEQPEKSRATKKKVIGATAFEPLFT